MLIDSRQFILARIILDSLAESRRDEINLREKCNNFNGHGEHVIVSIR
jgi:hypothetical protein